MDSLNMYESWEEMVDERILRAVREMGFETFTPIQEQAIPCLLNGEDIIGQAQTGTGKTAAFGIPMLQRVDPELKKLQCVILCPTRELAIQACEELRKIARYLPEVKILPVYGGQEIGKQISGLRGVQVIVGTPGRVMDHMRRHTIKLKDVNMVVLDEADEMLNMGFREDMELILGEIPGEHQTALFSATMPRPILEITGQFQKDAKMIRVAAKELTIPLVSQRYYRVKRQDKEAACIRLLEYYQPSLCLIFCNTKVKVDELTEVIRKAGFKAEGLHGDMSQHQRDTVMRRFRSGSTNILTATDVAARGIDVDNVEIVINYDIPQDIEYYVHRIGRTGRAGKTGRSFTFATAGELYRIREIERICNTTIEEKKLPGASKVLKAKADKYLNRAWAFHEHEDMELMMSYIRLKMDEKECDPLELAAAMLKMQVGDKGPEIEADKPEQREGSRGSKWGRGGRDGGRGRREGRGDRDSGRENRGSRDGRDSGRERREERGSRSGGYESRGSREDRGSRDSRYERREERGSRDSRYEGREERGSRGGGYESRDSRYEGREERGSRGGGYESRDSRYEGREERGSRDGRDSSRERREEKSFRDIGRERREDRGIRDAGNEKREGGYDWRGIAFARSKKKK